MTVRLIAILAIFFASSNLISFADDMITLATGENLTGRIVSETDKEVVIEIGTHGGTIFENRTIPRANIKSVARETIEEKRRRAMDKAYLVISRYQLDPRASLSLPQYDRAIHDLQGFLAAYPDSPSRDELRKRIADFQSERTSVVSCKIKRDGEWLEPDAAATALRGEKVERLLQDRESALKKGDFEKAVVQSGTLLESVSIETEPLQRAQELQDHAYGAWIKSLEKKAAAITTNISNLQAALTRARAEEAQAAAKVGQAEQRLRSRGEVHYYDGYYGYGRWRRRVIGGVEPMGLRAEVDVANNQLKMARDKIAATELGLTRAQNALAAVNGKLESVQEARTEANRTAVAAIQRVDLHNSPGSKSPATEVRAEDAAANATGPVDATLLAALPSAGASPVQQKTSTPESPFMIFLEKYSAWVLSGGGLALLILLRLVKAR